MACSCSSSIRIRWALGRLDSPVVPEVEQHSGADCSFRGAHFSFAICEANATAAQKELLLKPGRFVIPAKNARTQLQFLEQAGGMTKSNGQCSDYRIRVQLSHGREQTDSHGKIIAPQIHERKIAVVRDVQQVDIVGQNAQPYR